MGNSDQITIKVPVGKQGTGQPSIQNLVEIPLPDNTNPVDLEINSETEATTIAPSTTQTLVWHDSLDTIRAEGTAVMVATSINSAAVIFGGDEYGTIPLVTFDDPPSGVTALGTAVISGGSVISITMTENGSGYTSVPNVTIAPPAGGGASETASADAILDDTNVASVTMDEIGEGYASVPNVTFSGTGTGAAGTAVLTNTRVTSVTMTNNGNDDYDANPSVTFGEPTGVQREIIEINPGTTLCLLLFDGVTTLTAGDVEIYATEDIDTITDDDELLGTIFSELTTGEFIYSPTLIWLPQNKYLTIDNTSGVNTITINRIQTILFPTYP